MKQSQWIVEEGQSLEKQRHGVGFPHFPLLFWHQDKMHLQVGERVRVPEQTDREREQGSIILCVRHQSLKLTASASYGFTTKMKMSTA